MTTDEKKKTERWTDRRGPAAEHTFPSGELSPYESPDWLIRDASIGIEVSELLPPKGTNLFSGAQLLSFQREIVANAHQYYCEKGYPEVDVLVFSKLSGTKKATLGPSGLL